MSITDVRRLAPTAALVGFTLGLLALLAVVPAVGRIAHAGQGGAAEDSARLLRGTIDIHVHADPDNHPRALDGIEMAKLARSKGMRGIVLKNHFEPTAGLAYLARKAAPGLEVFGGVDLNRPVGGMNAAAVEHMTTIVGGWGRVVWMTTFDSENQARREKEKRPFVSVTRNGALLPETKAVIAVIAKHGLALATGHTAPEEALMLLREARKQGVKHMVVTHAIKEPSTMSLAQLRAATAEGAFLEFVGGTAKAPEYSAMIDRYTEVIRQVGPEFVILSSDLGTKGRELAPEGFGTFLLAMRKKGFTEQELDRMSRRNPAQLLGLPPAK